MRGRTARGPADAARAYRIVREGFDLPRLWADIEALDNRVAASVQLEMLLDIAGLVEHAAAWLLRGIRLALDPEIARFRPSIRQVAPLLPERLPAAERAAVDARRQSRAGA